MKTQWSVKVRFKCPDYSKGYSANRRIERDDTFQVTCSDNPETAAKIAARRALKSERYSVLGLISISVRSSDGEIERTFSRRWCGELFISLMYKKVFPEDA